MAGLDPAIHVLLLECLQRKTWMPGHQGVYARLRRATAGHDAECKTPARETRTGVAARPSLLLLILSSHDPYPKTGFQPRSSLGQVFGITRHRSRMLAGAEIIGRAGCSA